MTEHKHIYQAMFLLDNEEVRKGFNASRDWVKTTLEKYGIDVKVLRLWGERQLAYPIGGRKRATYLLGWLEASGDAVNEVKRELYLLGPVFRCLFLQEDSIPEEELATGIQEIADSEIIIPEEVEEFEVEEPYEEPEEEQHATEEPAEGEKSEEGEKAEGDKPEEKSEKPVADAAGDNSEEVKKDGN